MKKEIFKKIENREIRKSYADNNTMFQVAETVTDWTELLDDEELQEMVKYFIHCVLWQQIKDDLDKSSYLDQIPTLRMG